MHVLYPSDPISTKRVDEAYAEEFDAVRAAGLQTHLFSFEEFEAGRFKVQPPLPAGARVLYRGWMLPMDAHARLTAHLVELGAHALVGPTEYPLCHHLPQWYPYITDLTAETVVLDEGSDFQAALSDLDWDGYFVKDYVKSLSTGGGSLVTSPGEVGAVVEQIRKYRGMLEGGVCVRRVQQFRPGSERRFFVAAGTPYSTDEIIPELVHACAERVASPFFSVDTATLIDGSVVVVELGDGQVSDRKEWPAERFARMLATLG